MEITESSNHFGLNQLFEAVIKSTFQGNHRDKHFGLNQLFEAKFYRGDTECKQSHSWKKNESKIVGSIRLSPLYNTIYSMVPFSMPIENVMLMY